jgi:predicted nucleic acid-binding protein
MNFVLDSSFTLAWVLKDEATPETDRVLDSLGHGTKAFVPPLWRWEVGNALLNVERQKRATSAETSGHLLLLESLPVEVDEAALGQAWTATHLLARKHNLTSYDAAYLELALRRGLPLASFDKELLMAAKMERVSSVLGKK